MTPNLIRKALEMSIERLEEVVSDQVEREVCEQLVNWVFLGGALPKSAYIDRFYSPVIRVVSESLKEYFPVNGPRAVMERYNVLADCR